MQKTIFDSIMLHVRLIYLPIEISLSTIYFTLNEEIIQRVMPKQKQ